jgi:hypothetical protein
MKNAKAQSKAVNQLLIEARISGSVILSAGMWFAQ